MNEQDSFDLHDQAAQCDLAVHACPEYREHRESHGCRQVQVGLPTNELVIEEDKLHP